jgi:23S rRNA (cytosine1962-C5)-methyltransferase
MPPSWKISYGGLQLVVKPTSFKHTGLFPEQKAHWDWFRPLIEKANRPITVLNLFGYTGAASLAAAHAGAQVTHVDASKVAVSWARENAEASGLSEKPIRWIIDDVFLFVRRELKRGKRYDAIIMDPPAFGRGPKGELWKIEEGLIDLVADCSRLLSDAPLFFLMSGYAAGYSHHTFENIARSAPVLSESGMIESGEIALQESHAKRLLSCGIYTRWHS